MRLLLIRHGQTPSNVLGVIDAAAPGPGLTDLGHVQARAVPRALADEHVVGVYASPLVRTQLTAAPLAQARSLVVEVRDGLQEIEAGHQEGASTPEAYAAYIGTMETWADGDLAWAMPGGPDGHAFMRRFDDAVRGIADGHDADATVAIVSHGAAIRVWAAVRASSDPSATVRQRVLNTGLVVVEGLPDPGWSVVHWREEPLGGIDLEGNISHDVTGGTPTEPAD